MWRCRCIKVKDPRGDAKVSVSEVGTETICALCSLPRGLGVSVQSLQQHLPVSGPGLCSPAAALVSFLTCTPCPGDALAGSSPHSSCLGPVPSSLSSLLSCHDHCMTCVSKTLRFWKSLNFSELFLCVALIPSLLAKENNDHNNKNPLTP